MNLILKKLQLAFMLFIRITTGITIVTAVYISIFVGFEAVLDVRILWQILLVSLLCALGGMVYPCDDSKVSKRSLLLRQVVHFIFVNIVVLGLGWWFEWFDAFNWKMVAGMEICILFVYFSVTIVSYLSGYKTAERMNQKLQERG